MLALAKSRTRLLSTDRSGEASLRTITDLQPTASQAKLGLNMYSNVFKQSVQSPAYLVRALLMADLDPDQ